MERIAVVLPDLRAGGAERISVLLGGEFARRGYGVDVVLMRAEGALLSELQPDIRVIDLGARRFRNMPVPLAGYLRRERIGAVLAAMWPLTGITALATILSGYKGTLIVAEHTDFSRDPFAKTLSGVVHGVFGRLIYNRSDGVVAVSEGVKASLSRKTKLSLASIVVINNPVRPLAANAYADPAILHWLGSSSRTVIAVGSLKAAKDFSTLITSFARLRSGRDAQLLILGEGSLRRKLEAQIELLGLQGSVLMPGFVVDPYPYLMRSDLFVLSSAWEGLPGVLIEALVAGVPVVSTDCPSGPAEILENGKYGRLVPVGDPEALASAMAEALDATHDRDMLRRRGNEFSVERAADQYLALLDPGGKMLAGK